jgi:hypothetical protein
MATTPRGRRPRSKTLVRIDLENAYARLGVSPLMSAESIKELINTKRREMMRRRRARGEQRFGEEEAEMTRLQQIEDEIGTPKARARYDQANPQNELLTIQPCPRDVRFEPSRRAGLATAWLVEELGREVVLPSPDCLAFWAADPSVTALALSLAECAEAGPQRGGHAAQAAGADALPEVSELGRLAERPAAGAGLDPGPDPAGEGSSDG